jgi:4-hydroxymandelate oxidase
MLVPVEPLNLSDYERLAAERLAPAAHAYFAGGANDELTLAENVAAFRRWQIRPRVLVDVAEPSTATTVLGQEVALPVLVAPVAFQRVIHPDGEAGMGRAAAAAGTIMCLSTLATAGWQEIAETGVRRWFQFYVPRDEGLVAELLAGARAHGFGAIVLTVDTPVLGRRERSLRDQLEIPYELGIPALARSGLTPVTAFHAMSASVTWADVERFAAFSGLPIVLKGVLTAEDARLACEHGAAAVVVSNHGGRQLDGVAATIDALAEVVEAVEGRIEVLLDGGIRRGTDVVKALALGARAVLVGRAPLWGLAVDGERGAAQVLELLRAEVALALQLSGCRTPADLTRAHVARAAV